MPCWNLLGVEICLPSLDDIVSAVVAPITSFITSSLSGLVNTLTPYVDTIINTLTPYFQSAVDTITTFLADPLASIQTVLGDVWSAIYGFWDYTTGELTGLWSDLAARVSDVGTQIGTGLSGLQDSFNTGLSNLGSSIHGFIAASNEALNGAVDTAGAAISGAVQTSQVVLMGAFDGMTNAISGVMGSVFTGFGFLDSDALLGVHTSVGAILDTTLKLLGLSHSPVTPSEAAQWVPGFIVEVSAAVTYLHTMNVLAESSSLGQIDMTLAESWKYPSTAAALKVATEFAAMPFTEGLGPAFKRFILKSYQPNIPPYMDLISIYVKEGYLEDHWVELPAEMVDNFKELGYPEYWTKRLWGKHWNYPSVTQLFDMLHRTAGTRPEIGVSSTVLSDMLKLHDYEPKWRSPLEAISWRAWRIYDTRTAWEMGIDDDLTLEKRLIDQGYEPDDALLLAKVQKMFVLRSEIDRLLSESDQDYIEGWINEATLKADYDATPYNSYVVELRVARAKLRRGRELKRDIKAALIDRFKKDDLTEKEFTQELSRLGIVEDWIGAELTRAKASKLRRAG